MFWRLVLFLQIIFYFIMLIKFFIKKNLHNKKIKSPKIVGLLLNHFIKVFHFSLISACGIWLFNFANKISILHLLTYFSTVNSKLLVACLKSDRFKQITNQFFENYPKNQSAFQQQFNGIVKCSTRNAVIMIFHFDVECFNIKMSFVLVYLC